jgi:hypothetical protein
MDCGIDYLRAIAQGLGLADGDAIICYAVDEHGVKEPSKVKCFGCTTAIPHTFLSRKRDSEGDFSV